MDGGVEEAFASALWGLTVTRILLDVGNHTGIENALAIVGGITAAIHTLRLRVERTFAWEDKFKRLLLRFEHIQHRHYGMKLMGDMLINLRVFCGV